MQLWGLTDPGNLREQNQDSYAMVSFSRDRSLMIVCDGMGGAKSGNVASSLCRRRVHRRGAPMPETRYDAGAGR